MSQIADGTDGGPTEFGPMTPDELLDAAAAAIDRFGWIQQHMGGTDRGFCLYGALDYAHWQGREAGRLHDVETEGRAQSALRCVVGHTIIEWNDAPGRCKEEVTAALRMAAERSRNRVTQDGRPESTIEA